VRGRIANAKSFGWAIYAAGFAIWLFGYLSAGHAPLFDSDAATPWWISRFVPNLEAESGLALMFASMVLIYWPATGDVGMVATAERHQQADSDIEIYGMSVAKAGDHSPLIFASRMTRP